MEIEVSPKRLVWEILSVAPGNSIRVSQLVSLCVLFGVAENSVRVTLKRMVEQGLLGSSQRGEYALNRNLLDLNRKNDARANWINQLQEWQGEYLLMITTHLGRTDRTQLNLREQVLWDAGFRELKQGIFVRPANLSLSGKQVLADLVNKGLDADSILTVLKPIDAHQGDQLRSLWPLDALNVSYVELLEKANRIDHSYSDQDSSKSYVQILSVLEALRQFLSTDPLVPSVWLSNNLRPAVFNARAKLEGMFRSILRSKMDGVEQTEPK